MSIFVDTSVWYAAADSADKGNRIARGILSGGDDLVTTDHVLVETWTLLRWRIHRAAAEAFLEGMQAGVASLEFVGPGDLMTARAIGEAFGDQDFSLVDRTSFAVMERLGLERVASFDDDFSVYRWGPKRQNAFQVLR